MRRTTNRIAVEQAEGATVVRLTGEIDAALRGQAGAALAAALGGGRPVVLDAAGIRFADSTGVAFLLTCARACERAGLAVTLRDPPPQVVRVLRLLGVEDLLPTVRSADERVVVPGGRVDA